MMSRNSVSICRGFLRMALSKSSSLFIACAAVFVVGCVSPRITQFEVEPRIFCPRTDIQVVWATEDVEAISLTFNDAMVTNENDGTETIRNVTESGVLRLIATRGQQAVIIEQEIALFSGHHSTELATTGCLAGGAPTGILNVDTNGLPLIIMEVSARPLPVTVAHGGESHSHPAEPFDVWRRKVMAGSWEVTGMPQPGRSCVGSTMPGTPPEPKLLTLVGSCNGEPGDGPQSINPPRAVPISEARQVTLRCNGEPFDGATRGFHLWIREPTGCAVQDVYLASSFAEAVECARSEARDVVEDAAELVPGAVAYRVACGSPSTCYNFSAFTTDDARACALAWCPGSASGFLLGRCGS
jgi:hypothetical protein